MVSHSMGQLCAFDSMEHIHGSHMLFCYLRFSGWEGVLLYCGVKGSGFLCVLLIWDGVWVFQPNLALEAHGKTATWWW